MVYKKIAHFVFSFCLLVSTLFSLEKELPQFDEFMKLDREIANYGRGMSEYILNCSYYQDMLIRLLYTSPNAEEFYQMMDQLDVRCTHFDNHCVYASYVINFYTGENRTPLPQTISIPFEGACANCFLNTFKTGRHLTSEERELYFQEEIVKYEEDKVVTPFLLDASTIDNLQNEVEYIYALLPDGTITIAQEQVGEKEYHSAGEHRVEAFTHPNHTVLAGSPEQPVVTAGSLVPYRCGDKQLFFVSCKSGHFQPTFDSVSHMRTKLSELGIHPSSVIRVPDVDLSGVILKLYKKTMIPLCLDQEEARLLFVSAQERWNKTYHEIDRNVLMQLSEGNFEIITPSLLAQINKQREEGTYMRSAYHLFSANHEAPKQFHQLIKSFGKLKDALKHNAPERVKAEAANFLKRLENYEHLEENFEPATRESFYDFFCRSVDRLRELIEKKRLCVEEYHDVKKMSRELGILFMSLSQNVKLKEKGFLIYRTASKAFFSLNERLAKEHDAYIARVLKGELEEGEEYFIELSNEIATSLLNCLNHLAICPPQFEITIYPADAWWLINWSKDWYISHYHFLGREQDRGQAMIPFLLKVVEGEGHLQDFSAALEEIRDLKRDAEIARNALIFLDVSHTVSEDIHLYIQSLGQLIECCENDTWEEKAREAARYMLGYYGLSPTAALENWVCTDQESFNLVLKECVSCLGDLGQMERLSFEQAHEIGEKMQALQDLMNLFRQSGLRSLENILPIVCYDVLEERAGRLVKTLNAEGKCGVSVTPAMRRDGTFILQSIGSGSDIRNKG